MLADTTRKTPGPGLRLKGAKGSTPPWMGPHPAGRRRSAAQVPVVPVRRHQRPHRPSPPPPRPARLHRRLHRRPRRSPLELRRPEPRRLRRPTPLNMVGKTPGLPPGGCSAGCIDCCGGRKRRRCSGPRVLRFPDPHTEEAATPGPLPHRRPPRLTTTPMRPDLPPRPHRCKPPQPLFAAAHERHPASRPRGGAPGNRVRSAAAFVPGSSSDGPPKPPTASAPTSSRPCRGCRPCSCPTRPTKACSWACWASTVWASACSCAARPSGGTATGPAAAGAGVVSTGAATSSSDRGTVSTADSAGPSSPGSDWFRPASRGAGRGHHLPPGPRHRPRHAAAVRTGLRRLRRVHLPGARAAPPRIPASCSPRHHLPPPRGPTRDGAQRADRTAPPGLLQEALHGGARDHRGRHTVDCPDGVLVLHEGAAQRLRRGPRGGGGHPHPEAPLPAGQAAEARQRGPS